MDLSELLHMLNNVKPSGKGYLALCPAHDDQRASLSICQGDDDRILLYCHAGCTNVDIVKSLGLTMKDLFTENSRASTKIKPTVNKIYEYVDEQANLLYQVCRKTDKSFTIRRPDGNGGFIYSLGDVKPVLYRLPELLTGINNKETVYIAEGEKDVDNLLKLGLTSTTNPMGAGKWRDNYSDYLKGAKVAILPDNDEAGFKHAEQVAGSLYRKASKMKIVKLDGLQPKGDISDWLNNGGTVDKLKLLVESAPQWKPEKVSDNKWAEPEPIEPALHPVVTFPDEIIPKPFKAWVKDTSYRIQVPVDYLAVPLMIICGALIGVSCSIRPKAKDDWQVVPNLWGGVVGKPGTMKSPALNETISFVARLEAEANELFKTEITAYEAEKAAQKAEIEALKAEMNKAARGKSSRRMDELKKEYLALEPPPPPIWKRYKTNDSTVEKLAELLQENPRGLLLFRDELIGLLASWEREGRQPDRAFFLEAWNGKGSLTTDRIGRGTVHCDNLCISILGGVQPAKLLAYLYQAQSELENDGLLQRMQLLIYPDELKDWKLIDEYPDKAARDRVFNIIKSLCQLDPLNHGAGINGSDTLPYFRFSEEAQELFNQWLTALQIKLINNDETPLMIEHLNKYRSLMPSLALIDHLVAIADGASGVQVTLASAEKAAGWCEYLESHARRVYGLTGNIVQRVASELAKRIKNKKLADGFTVREVYRKGWHLLDNKETVKTACDELVEAGWLIQYAIPIEGRQPKEAYLINPKIFT